MCVWAGWGVGGLSVGEVVRCEGRALISTHCAAAVAPVWAAAAVAPGAVSSSPSWRRCCCSAPRAAPASLCGGSTALPWEAASAAPETCRL